MRYPEHCSGYLFYQYKYQMTFWLSFNVLYFNLFDFTEKI